MYIIFLSSKREVLNPIGRKPGGGARNGIPPIGAKQKFLRRNSNIIKYIRRTKLAIERPAGIGGICSCCGIIICLYFGKEARNSS